MHKYIKFFYENKSKILKVVLIIVFVLIIIQVLNILYKEQQQEEYQQAKNNIDSSKNTTIDNSDYLINQNKDVKNDDNQEFEQMMEMFVGYCNSNNIKSAYDMLTQDCKDKLFPTVNDFKLNYVDILFDQEKIYSMQAWDKEDYKVTYVINYTQDILVTGGQGKTIQEYYTFVMQEDGSYKMNINNFIYSQKYEDLNTEEEGVLVKVLSKDVYKENVIYEFQVFNNTENSILLNGGKTGKSIYLLGNNKATFSSLQSDFDKDDEIVIKPQNNRKFRIKFNKVYNTNVMIKELVFDNVILNYEEYLNSKDNDEEYNNRKELKINLIY